jgi:sulfite reductase beta subunit-like hemoprotein
VIADVPAVSSGLKADGKGLPSLPVLLASGSAVAERDAYEHWVSLAVSPTRFGDGLQSVRLFVPYGDLTACQLRGLARLAADAGSPSVRLLPSQDVLIPLVREEQLPGVYGRLRGELSDVDLTFRSYKGHIMTCVGAAVCKIGLVDARSVADRLAEALDRYLPAATQERQALQRLVADEVRISGCPNACSGHPAARLGIGCVNQKVDGQIVPHARIFSGAGVEGGVPRLSEDETGALYDVGALVQAAVLRLAELAGAGGLARRIEH